MCGVLCKTNKVLPGEPLQAKMVPLPEEGPLLKKK